MPSPRVTLADLAAHVGLSVTTVSDALHDTGRVADSTRTRVRQAAAELGYIPNRAAQNLRHRRSTTVGLFVPQRVIGMEFYLTFALAAADHLGSRGYDLTLLSSQPSTGLRDDWLQHAGVIVIDATLEDTRFADNLSQQPRLVTAGKIEGVPESALLGIIEADYRTLITHALEQLHADTPVRRPVMISYAPADAYSWSRQLIDGYHEWCERHGVEPLLRTVDLSSELKGVDEAVELIRAHADADLLIFTGTVLALTARSHPGYEGLFPAGSPRSVVLTTNPMETSLVEHDAALHTRAKEFAVATADLLLEQLARLERDGEPVFTHRWFNPHLHLAGEVRELDSATGRLRRLTT